MSDRKVRRVLVMLDYGESEMDNGEVFDLTALVLEMLPQAPFSASLKIEVEARKSFGETPAHELKVSFGGYSGGEYVHAASHLDDVVNASLPDGERVKAIRERARRLQRKVEDLRRDAMAAKLMQVAEIRHQHPIARFSGALPGLAEASIPKVEGGES